MMFLVQNYGNLKHKVIYYHLILTLIRDQILSVGRIRHNSTAIEEYRRVTNEQSLSSRDAGASSLRFMLMKDNVFKNLMCVCKLSNFAVSTPDRRTQADGSAYASV